MLRDIELDPAYFEEVLTFRADKQGESPETTSRSQQHCISIERPQLTMSKVVLGMIEKGSYRQNPDLRRKYTAKVCAVLRLIGKSLLHLHGAGAVHGNGKCCSGCMCL